MKHLLAAGGMLIAGHQLIKASLAGGLEAGVLALTSYSMKYGKFLGLKYAKAGIPLVVGLGGSYVAAKTGVNAYTPNGWNL